MDDVKELAGVEVEDIEGGEEGFPGTRHRQVVLYVFLLFFDLI